MSDIKNCGPGHDRCRCEWCCPRCGGRVVWRLSLVVDGEHHDQWRCIRCLRVCLSEDLARAEDYGAQAERRKLVAWTAWAKEVSA